MTNKLLDSATSDSTSPKLLVFGNSLLDISVQIKDDELLKKYNLEKNGQKEVSLAKISKLLGDAKTRYSNFTRSPGGSSLNTSRILAAMGQQDLLFFGAIGKDQNGKYLKDILERSSVSACLQQLDEIDTGTVVCLSRGEDRSLTANVGAALKVEMTFIEAHLNALTSEPSHVYIEGFFIPEKMPIVRYVVEKFSKNPNCTLITNLNAPYIVKTHPKDITWLAKKADIVFGNRDEFEELASINGFQAMEDQLTDLLNDYTNTSKQKKIVVTDGASPVYFYAGNAKGIEVESIEVPSVNEQDIIDTTGAGDSFVAGFIYALMEEKSTKECVELGCEISAKVIKVIGCNLPIE